MGSKPQRQKANARMMVKQHEFREWTNMSHLAGDPFRSDLARSRFVTHRLSPEKAYSGISCAITEYSREFRTPSASVILRQLHRPGVVHREHDAPERDTVNPDSSMSVCRMVISRYILLATIPWAAT